MKRIARPVFRIRRYHIEMAQIQNRFALSTAVEAGNDVAGARMVRRNEQLRVRRGKSRSQQPGLYLACRFRGADIVRRASVDQLAQDLAREGLLARLRCGVHRCGYNRRRNQECTEGTFHTGKALWATQVIGHVQDSLEVGALNARRICQDYACQIAPLCLQSQNRWSGLLIYLTVAAFG
jgi:hypothetical protein